MSEKEPGLTLRYGDGKRLELTPENTTLYTFLGRTAIGDLEFENQSLNHAFVTTGHTENDKPIGNFYFEKFHAVYKDIAAFAIKNSFPHIANMRTIPACDLKAYLGQVDREQAAFAAKLEGVSPEDFIA